MKVIVKARHMHLTRSLRAHAEEKLGRAVARIFDRPAARIDIELSDLGNVNGGSKECRVSVHMPKGKTINIHEVHEDLYSAINLAHDRMLEQVKRERGRRRMAQRARRESQKLRHQTAREVLTVAPEPWELEVAEFEQHQQQQQVYAFA